MELALTFMFQSHAGSIEARLGEITPQKTPKFQSHAGSIEASLLQGHEDLWIEVSIPRWFD